jgi:hypothetical protein
MHNVVGHFFIKDLDEMMVNALIRAKLCTHEISSKNFMPIY